MSEAAGAKDSVQLQSLYSRSVVLTSLLQATVLRLLTLGHPEKIKKQKQLV